MKDLYLGYIVVIFSLFFLLSNTNKEYSVSKLRDLYGSGNPQIWPKPFLFDEAKEGFQDIGILPKMEFPAENPYSEAKVQLGKELFFDPQLSESGKISCATCHLPEKAFSDGKMVALGHKDQEGIRNTLSIMNSGYSTTLFWDGKVKSLEDQVKHPIENPIEMNLHMDLAINRIVSNKNYRKLFRKAFGNKRVTEERLVKAIATYERTLVSGKSRFDVFIEGKKDEFSDAEIRGLHLFRTKANCINCHNSGTFSDNKFHNIGLDFFSEDDNDLGRYEITKNPEDKRKFRTPSLREVALTKPYMHNGQFPELRNVMMMYNVGFGKQNLTPEQLKDPHFPKKSGMIKSLNLEDEEISDIISFLRTLKSY